jgi:DNA-binding SARP family transcriptional activator/TolB-like protein
VLRLTTFGGLSLSRDGVPLTGAAAQRSRLALLALLASAGPGGISRDKVLLYLWPESDSERARHALKQAVYALRRDLGDDETIVGTSSLSLNPSLVDSDLREFETAIAKGDCATAAALYAGPFLDGVYLKDAPEFERWSADQRARLAHAWCDAVERLAKQAESTGAWRDAVTWRRQLAAAEPLSGRITIALMRAMAESGDVAAALQHYRVHETLVREELETAPDPDVLALADELKSGRWQRAAPIVVDTPPPPAPRTSGTTRTSPASGTSESGAGTPTEPIAAPAGLAESAKEAAAIEAAALTGRRRSRMLVPGLVAVAILAVASVGYLAVPSDLRELTLTFFTRNPPAPHKNVVVVAPFENKTNHAEWDELGDAIADRLTTELDRAGIQVLDDRSRRLSSEVLSKIPGILRGDDPARQLAKEIGSDTVVAGRYYLRGDTIVVEANLIEVSSHKVIRNAPTVVGPARKEAAQQLVANVASRVAAALWAVVDRAPGAHTTALSQPPSQAAFERAERAWEHFFTDAGDTVFVFAELAAAMQADSTYSGPLMMKAYILDVKGYWQPLSLLMPRLRTLAPAMTRHERAVLEVFEADLRGDPYGRMRASRRIVTISPGSHEMPVLAALSALYIGHPREAIRMLDLTDGNHGINLGAPVYWGWRATAEHFAGDRNEPATARTGFKRFPRGKLTAGSMARVYAVDGDTAAMRREVFAGKIDDDGDPALAHRELMLFSGRELRAHGHPGEARGVFESALREITQSPDTTRRGRIQNALALYELGRYEESRAVFLQLRGDSTDVDVEGRLGAIALRLSDTTEADRISVRLAAMKGPFLLGRNTKWRAHLAAIREKWGEASQLLRRATGEGYRLMDMNVVAVHHDADFVELIRTPEYAALLKDLEASER